MTVLLDCGTDPNAKTAECGNRDHRSNVQYYFSKWAGTALHVAAMVGAPALVSLLLKHGKDPNADQESTTTVDMDFVKACIRSNILLL